MNTKFNTLFSQILDYSKPLCSFYKESHKEFPDVIYTILAFEKFTNQLAMDFTLGRIIDRQMLHNKIFEFDHVVSSARENLIHYIPTETKTNNGLYSVLFSILQSIEIVYDECLEYDDEIIEVEKHFPD